jgi:hypothetical protein
VSGYKPQRGDLVEVVNRTDGWNGLRGIVEGVNGAPAGRITFYGIAFPEREGGAGPTRWAQFMASQLRPLVMLDAPQVDLNVAAGLLRNAGFSELARQIEAQTKPPRIPEPGLWGVVEATWSGNGETGIPRAEWVRVKGNRWASSISNIHAAWSDLIDPVEIRKGVA